MLFCVGMLAAMSGVKAQVTGSFVVNGSISSYYPVAFYDGGWSSNVATEFSLGRSNVHQDATWRGAIISRFRFHCTQWGNGANFIDADLRQNTGVNPAITNFVGGWEDASQANGNDQIVIWLRGGTTTYYYNSNYAITPVVYDGVQNALPFVISGQPSVTLKTVPDAYVDVQGFYTGNDLRAGGNVSSLGSGLNAFTGPIVVGTTVNDGYSLAVNGPAIFTKAVVKPFASWPDYVFGRDYALPSLDSLSGYIQANHHLPGVPSADSIAHYGLDLGAGQAALLQKIEELTLYAIDQQRDLHDLRETNEKLTERLRKLEASLQK